MLCISVDTVSNVSRLSHPINYVAIVSCVYVNEDFRCCSRQILIERRVKISSFCLLFSTSIYVESVPRILLSSLYQGYLHCMTFSPGKKVHPVIHKWIAKFVDKLNSSYKSEKR